MPPSKDNQAQVAYAREYMDRALSTEKGIKVKFEEEKQAIRCRADCYYARKLDRKASTLILPSDDPQYGKSQYDLLRIGLDKTDGIWLIFEPQDLKPISAMEVVEL